MGRYTGNKGQFKAMIDWELTPKALRRPGTLTELAKELKVSRKTLWSWRKSPEFMAACGIEMTDPDSPRSEQILEGLYRKGKNGDAAAAKAWFALSGQIEAGCPHGLSPCPFEEWSEELSRLSSEILEDIVNLLEQESEGAFREAFEIQEGESGRERMSVRI